MADSIVALHATTKEKISKFLSDGITNRIALLNEIKEAGNFKENVDGGRSFSEPSIVGDSNAVGAYDAGDDLVISQQGGIEKFQYTPAFAYANIRISGPEMAMNAGEQASIDLYKAYMTQAKNSLFNCVDAYLCGRNNSSPTVGGITYRNQLGWLGLQDIVSDTVTETIFGTGVARTGANAKAQNQIRTTAIASATAWNTSSAGRIEMSALYRLCTFGNGPESPSLVLMTGSLFDAYHTSLQNNERFVGIQEKAGGGYKYLVFQGNAKVSFTDSITLQGHFYMLNPNYLKFKILKEKNFKVEELQRLPNQDVYVSLITLGGALTTGAPRYNGVYTGGTF